MMWVLRILTIHYGLPFILLFLAWKFLPRSKPRSSPGRAFIYDESDPYGLG